MKYLGFLKSSLTGDHHVKGDEPSSERQISCPDLYAEFRL
jgi:hypothetical protein